MDRSLGSSQNVASLKPALQDRNDLGCELHPRQPRRRRFLSHSKQKSQAAFVQLKALPPPQNHQSFGFVKHGANTNVSWLIITYWLTPFHDSISWFDTLWVDTRRFERKPLWSGTLLSGAFPSLGRRTPMMCFLCCQVLRRSRLNSSGKASKYMLRSSSAGYFSGHGPFLLGGECLSRPPRRNKLFCDGLAPARAALVHLSSRKRQLELELSWIICSVNRSPRLFWAGLLLDNFHVGNSVHGRFQLQPRSNWSAYQQPKAWIRYWQPEPCGYECGRDSIQEFETVPHAGPVWKGVDSSFIGTALVSHTSLRRNFWCLAPKHIRP